MRTPDGRLDVQAFTADGGGEAADRARSKKAPPTKLRVSADGKIILRLMQMEDRYLDGRAGLTASVSRAAFARKASYTFGGTIDRHGSLAMFGLRERDRNAG